MASVKLVTIPGQPLCASDKQHLPGRGTYVLGSHIFSALLGTVVVEEQEDGTRLVEVLRGPRTAEGEDVDAIPVPGNVVTARVTSVEDEEVECNILCLGDLDVSSSNYRGFIEPGDVRSFERDRVRLTDCFREGDVILARIADVADDNPEEEDADDFDEDYGDEDLGEEDEGTSVRFQLSTAEPELGVVSGTSEHGGKLIPISWCEMQCALTRTVERRKVAKVVPETFDESKWKSSDEANSC